MKTILAFSIFVLILFPTFSMFAPIVKAGSLIDLASEIQRKGYPGITPSPEVVAQYQRMNQSLPRLSDWASISQQQQIHARRILVILIDFPDHVGTQNQAHYQTLLFGGVQGSLDHYYTEVSYGQLTVTGTVAGQGWYRSANNLVWWGADGTYHDDANTDRFELAREAVVAADADVDFKAFDTNDNDVIDPGELSLCIVHAGDGQESSGVSTDLWSHRWYIFGAGYTSPHTGAALADTIVDGCRISRHSTDDVGGYFMQAENSPMGTFAHEFGHDLGLIDLYDTDSTVDYGQVVGDWSLMDTGSWLDSGNTPSHLDPYSKIRLEWLSPTVVSSYLVVSIDQAEATTGNRLYRLNIPGTQQYFLVENRRQTGYDAHLPESGILIWHIDEGMPNNNDGPPTNSYYRVALEQPGGTGNDPYGHAPGTPNYRGALDTAAYSNNDAQTTFDSTTTPNSDSNEGTETLISISNVGTEGASTSVTFFSRRLAYVYCSWGMWTMQGEINYLHSLSPNKYLFDWYNENNIGNLWANLGKYKALLVDEDTFYSDGSWSQYGGPIYNSFKSHASDLDNFVRNGGGIFTSGENDLYKTQAWDWLPPGMQVTSYDPESTSNVHVVFDPGTPKGLYSYPNTITDSYLNTRGHIHAWFSSWDTGYIITTNRIDNNKPVELYGIFENSAHTSSGCIVVSHVEAESSNAWEYLQNQLDFIVPATKYKMIVVSPLEGAVFRFGDNVLFEMMITDDFGNPGTGASVTVNSPTGAPISLIETPAGSGIYVNTYTLSPTDPVGTWAISFVASIEGEFPKKSVPVIIPADQTPPTITVITPRETPEEALQDGVTLKATVSDPSGVDWVKFSIRETDGTTIDPSFESMSPIHISSDTWQLLFNTYVPKLPDGNYLFIVNASDTFDNEGSKIVLFSIRNWASLQLLPATTSNKAGRTMPIKFSLRVYETVDPAKPFVYNEQLTIKIYKKGYPNNVLQTSTYGTGSTNYRIDVISEKYITNFKTLNTPATYVVEIYRKGMLIGSFEFKTVK
jgi:M6 family metalloprotease-like protein